MRIIVLAKQVPEVSEVEIDPERGTLKREGVQSQTNPYDLHALEAALTLRERFGGKVSVISMGPPQAKAVITEALSMGADDGVLLTDAAFAGADTLATAFTLSQAARKLGFDLILAGLQSTDGDTGQVGPGVAEFLQISHVSYVSKVEDVTEDKITVVSDLGDRFLTMRVSYPCLLSVSRELNQPRLPSYRLWREVRNAAVKSWSLGDLPQHEECYYGLDGSPTRVKKIFPPRREVVREIWEGRSEELAAKFCMLVRR